MKSLTLSAFSSISRGMTIETIEARLGGGIRRRAPGFEVLDYPLSDGSRVEVLYANPQLIKIVHYRLNGTRMTWVPTVTVG